MTETSLSEFSPVAAAPAQWADFLALLKPRVMSLVVFTGLTGLVCADTPMNPFLAAIAVLCIAVGAGASGALNMAFDSDIDAIMRRTMNRPVAAGRISRADAAAFGGVLSAFAVMLMGLAVNYVAAGLLLFTIVFYALVYTVWLKRSTPQNIVIGGAAGGSASGDRLGRGDRPCPAERLGLVRHYLPLDTAALLGASPEHRG